MDTGSSKIDSSTLGGSNSHPAAPKLPDRISRDTYLIAITLWPNHQTVIQITEAMEFAATARGDDVAASGR